MKKYFIMRNLLYLLKWLGNVERVMSSKEIHIILKLITNQIFWIFSNLIFCLFSHARNYSILPASMAFYLDFIDLMRTIIIRGLYIFYLLFESQKKIFKEFFFSENSAFMYGQYSRGVCNQERVMIRFGQTQKMYEMKSG